MLLSQARLGIITVLMAREEVCFSDLRALAGLTQGNLGSHLQQLEEAGYVAIRKEFLDRKPRTTVRITARGRRAFLAHVARLNAVAQDGS
ncbi:MAG: transcriptional regulator [Planctomycetes bacterium]|nr:transcriptional regulator [Planctomycetota bacterium]